jgi:fatty acid synthase subunit alpha
VDKPPVYRDVALPTAPNTEITAKGDIVYTEVSRQNVRKLESYVKEMAAGGAVEHSVNLDKVQSDLDKLWELVNSQPSITPAQKSAIKSMYGEVIKSLGSSTSPETQTEVEEAHMPFLHLKRKTGTSWAYSHKLTNICKSRSSNMSLRPS